MQFTRYSATGTIKMDATLFLHIFNRFEKLPKLSVSDIQWNWPKAADHFTSLLLHLSPQTSHPTITNLALQSVIQMCYSIYSLSNICRIWQEFPTESCKQSKLRLCKHYKVIRTTHSYCKALSSVAKDVMQSLRVAKLVGSRQVAFWKTS